MAPEPNLVACFINLSHHSVCLYIYPSITARQWFTENITVVTNTHTHAATELLDKSFSMLSVSCQKCGQFILELHTIT
jgi:hypothetical protein